MAFIDVRHVSKEFRIPRREPGVLGAFRSLFHREYTVKRAVEDVSFSIAKGELVGYIGPNGAGKSTTIKMLTGVLTPTSGEILVGGLHPYRERRKNAKGIGVVFGQRSQLYWDLPVSDTFALQQKLYEIPDDVYRRNRARYTELLGLEGFMDQPVRQLSLGQKMKANLALAMLHDPAVLYLDEPTIGLDVVSRRLLRENIREINRTRGATVMLTTHDMDDIEAVCSRVVLIDQGRILFDGALSAFRQAYEEGFEVILDFKRNPAWREDRRFTLTADSPGRWAVRVDKALSVKEAFLALIAMYEPENVAVREQRVEDIIARIFAR